MLSALLAEAAADSGPNGQAQRIYKGLKGRGMNEPNKKFMKKNRN